MFESLLLFPRERLYTDAATLCICANNGNTAVRRRREAGRIPVHRATWPGTMHEHAAPWPAPWPASGWLRLMAGGVGDAKAHRRSVRASRFRRCLDEATVASHFRGHPSEQHLVLQAATRRRQLMGQNLAQEVTEDGGLG